MNRPPINKMEAMVRDLTWMAYLDDDEIIATIRHEMRLEDEEGRCNDVLPQVFRRAKNGGLPLDFRSLGRADEEEDDGRQSPGYTIPIEEEVSSTKELIVTRLRSRTTDSGQLNDELEARRNKEECSLEADRVMYVERSAADVERRARERQEGGRSALTRALDDAACSSTAVGAEAAYREYAVHDASQAGNSVPSKKILIVYAIPEAENNNGEVETITICIKSAATVADLIGLACYKFAEKTGVAPSAPRESLQLYIAEETGEIDDEFPPMEAHKRIAEFGFTVLAMRADERGSASRPSSSTVTVHVPGREGVRYVIDLPDRQQTLRWLRDEAVKRKLEGMDEDRQKVANQMAQYNLELVEKSETPLDLDKSIASIGYGVEYVLIRRNCSRAGWMPSTSSGGMGAASVGGGGSTVEQPPPPTPTTAKIGGAGFDFPLAVSASVRPHSTMISEESAMAAFNVDRLHKYKNKWPAMLVLRWNWIEVTPIPTERRLSNRFQGGGQKSNVIAWEDLADARIRERRNPSGGLSIVQLSITWLPPPGVPQTPTTPLRKPSAHLLFETSPPPSASLAGAGGGAQSLMDIAGRYKETEKWKVLNLEMLSYSEGDKAVKLISDGIKQRNSCVSQAYLHSEGGELRPGAAAEAALAHRRRQARPMGAAAAAAAGTEEKQQPSRVERKRSSIAKVTSGFGRLFRGD